MGRKKQRNEIRKTSNVSKETHNCSPPEVKGRDELEGPGEGRAASKGKGKGSGALQTGTEGGSR